jgi:hypothetical protein
MLNPYRMEMYILAEGSKQREDIDYLSGVWWQFRLIDRWSQLRSQIQSKRYILRQVQRIIGQCMLPDVTAKSIPAIACSRRCCQLLVYLFPNLQAYRTGIGKIRVVTTNIKGHGKVEQRFIRLKSDSRTTGFRLSDPRSRRRRCLGVFDDRRSAATAGRVRLSGSRDSRSQKKSGGKTQRKSYCVPED